MSCCGERPERGRRLAPTWQDRAVLVRYLGRTAICVTGTATGRSYKFSVNASEQPVDRHDLPALLHTRWFQAVRVIPSDPN